MPSLRSITQRHWAHITLLAFMAVGTGCADMHTLRSSDVRPLGEAQPAQLRNCDTLANTFRHAQTHIASSVLVPAGVVTLAGAPIAEHCLVKGSMRQREAGAQRYAIGFEIRLPKAWNGRFYYQGNGGLDGVVAPALGALGGGPTTGALVQGFAVLSSDAGHTMGQTVAFGADPQARADYGYQAVAALTPMAKALIASAYGKGPDRSYIGGCSNGGRHTMVAAARLGDAYDGYLAGAPGYRLPLSALAQLWGATLWQDIATPGATTVPPGGQGKPIPDLGSAFTPTERRTVGDAVQSRCDALDGVRDGMTLDTKACQAAFDIERDVATCSGPRDGRCLSTDQKRVLSRVQAGHQLANGQPLYASFPWDPSIASPDWSNWKFVNAVTRGPLGVGRVFSTPPGAPVDLRKLDVEARRAAMDAINPQFKESVLAQMTPPGHENPTNLQALWARGARMIIYHGSGDPVFSVQDTVHWLERVDTVQGGRSADSIRLFVVPGMPHCRGGASTDQFDLLTPLVRWVEQGIAPDAVLARSRGAGNQGGVNPEVPASWSPGRTRPLCAWPAVARYNGSGPIDDAASFNCHP